MEYCKKTVFCQIQSQGSLYLKSKWIICNLLAETIKGKKNH